MRRKLLPALLCMCWLSTARGQVVDPGEAPDPPAPQVAPGEISDEQIRASIARGVEFLLSQRHDDNWESRFDSTGKPVTGKPPWPGGNFGAETSLVVYALLHTGASIADPRLFPESTTMAPSVKWLCKIQPTGTYAVGLHASALALTPKTREAQAALKSDRAYLLSAMGTSGGYSYTDTNNNETRKEAAQTTLREAQKNLANANRGNNADEIKKALAEVKAAQAAVDRANAPRPAPPSPARKVEALRQQVATEANRLAKAQNSGKPSDVERAKSALEMAKASLAIAEAELKLGYTFFGDLSNAQYAALGSWAVEEAGENMPVSYWTTCDKFWRGAQREDGGWAYANQANVGSRNTMTVAGVASLAIFARYLGNDTKLDASNDRAIDSAIAWLGKNHKPDSMNLYYLFGCERVGRTTGLRYFGSSDWYQDGAKRTVTTQAANGSWEYFNNRVVGTSYALLFLARGRNPVWFNKLQYKGAWNARPRDVAHLSEWAAKEFQHPLNWRIARLEDPPKDWTKAPILLITGSQDPKFSAEDLAKLREYIMDGGTIVSAADAGAEPFTSAMNHYAAEIVRGAKLTVVPNDHYLLQGVAARDKARLSTLSAAGRDVWIHSAKDLGNAWQKRTPANTTEAFDVMANLVRHLRLKPAPAKNG